MSSPEQNYFFIFAMRYPVYHSKIVHWAEPELNYLGQLISEWNFGVCKSCKKWSYFLGDLKTSKFHSEINWPSTYKLNRKIDTIISFILYTFRSNFMNFIDFCCMYISQNWFLQWKKYQDLDRACKKFNQRDKVHVF